MNRRGFLGSILALGAAPAIVRADSLMPIRPRGLWIIEPLDYSHAADALRYASYTQVESDVMVISADAHATFTELVTRTFLANRLRFMANVTKNNALLE